MSGPNPFPKFPRPQLTRDDVVNYLVKLKNDGHDVYQHQDHDHIFVLALPEDARVLFVVDAFPGTCQVQLQQLGNPRMSSNAESTLELEHAVAKAVAACGQEWPFRPTTGRLSETAPATNYLTISQLVGSSEVQAIFDPFLDNRSLTILLDILSFGGSISNDIRLLSSTKMVQGAVPRLTKTVVDAWFGQRGITSGEVRLMGPSEHRRFMLLSGGQSLLIGCSLNSIAKNEAIRLEPDAADRVFFDGLWAGAAPLA